MTTTDDIKALANRIIETGAAATKGPWRAAPDCVASFDPEAVERMRAYLHDSDGRHCEVMAANNRWSAEEDAEYRRLTAERSARLYDGGAMVCESIGPADRAFVAAARDAPEVARFAIAAIDVLYDEQLQCCVFEGGAEVFAAIRRAIGRRVGSDMAAPTSAAGRLRELEARIASLEADAAEDVDGSEHQRLEQLAELETRVAAAMVNPGNPLPKWIEIANAVTVLIAEVRRLREVTVPSVMAEVDAIIAAAMEERERLRAEVERLTGAGKRVADLDDEQFEIMVGEVADFMAKDKTVAQCAHCLEIHPRDASGMLREHTMTCAANPLVQQLAEVTAQREEARRIALFLYNAVGRAPQMTGIGAYDDLPAWMVE